MQMSEQAKYKSFLLKFGYWAAIILVLVLFVKYLLGPLAPFLIALAIAMPMNGLARKLTKKVSSSRKFVAVVLVILCYLLVAGLLVLIVTGVASVIVDWAEQLPDFFTNSVQPAATNFIDNVITKLERFDPEIRETVEEALPGVMTNFSNSIMSFSVRILGWASSIGTKLPSFFLATVICIIASVFLAVDYDGVARAVLGILPPKAQEVMKSAKRALGIIIGKYAKSYMIILFMTFAEIAIGLLIIGIDNAAAIAALIAVFDILPIVGSGIILAPWAIIKLVQGSIGLGIGLAVLLDARINLRLDRRPPELPVLGRHRIGTETSHSNARENRAARQ